MKFRVAPSSGHSPLFRLGLIALILLAIGGGLYFFQRAPEGGAPGKPGGRNKDRGRPQPVSVAEVRTADMPVWVTAIGTTTPKNLVTVRSRVDGELVALHFQEGQLVQRGQALADIDPRPFQVQLTQASGQLAKDTALLKNAELDLARYKDLLSQDSIARQQVDTQEALVRQYQGTVAADRGNVDSARLQLSYAHITAPISGRIGLRQVDPGNQVHASDANGLAVIAQLQPITVVFAVPETRLRDLTQSMAGKQAVVVEAWDREQKTKLASGRLLTTDNLIDPTTGTLKLKAEFTNADNGLFPNQFVNVRLLLGRRKDATVIPGAAILRGSKGAYVYRVGQDEQVHPVTVVPGPSDGELVAVEGDLPRGSRVVTDGADKLRDGTKVEVIQPTPAGADRKPRQGQGRHRAAGAPSTDRN